MRSQRTRGGASKVRGAGGRVVACLSLAAALFACEGTTNLGGADVGGGGPLPKADKVDILIEVDNSRSMIDKQELLGLALSDLVQELVNPRCIDTAGAPVAPQPSNGAAPCPEGSTRRHTPVTDIHLGMITSSLGGHGADVCMVTGPGTATNDDKGHLVARTAPPPDGASVPTYADKGFLAWDPGARYTPPGESDPVAMAATLKEMVFGVGQLGCGYESQLESWYRFLVDPEPYQSISIQDGEVVLEGVDTMLLQQRADFLRPDSLLAIVLLTDENDCSIRDEGQYYLAAQQSLPNQVKFHMPAPRAECATDPGDPCCLSCGQDQGSCPDDPACTNIDGTLRMLDDLEDPVNVRCFEQKRRFGIDFLNPITRYTTALTSTEVPNRAGELVRNPLFSDLNPGDADTSIRDPGLVLLAGIVGVPWQDLARDPQDLTKGFKDAGELNADIPGVGTTWDVIVGDPSSFTRPGDPFMLESTEPRAGVNPITGDAITQPGTQNPINWSEWTIPGRNDLQFSCVFALAVARDCSQPSESCDCDQGTDSGLCASNPEDGGQKTLQVRAKAYPGLRELAVLKGIGAQGVAASICPKQMTDPIAADYGYRPSIRALLDRMVTRL